MRNLALAILLLPASASAQSARDQARRWSGGNLSGPSFTPIRRVAVADDEGGQAVAMGTAVDFTCVKTSQDEKATADCLAKAGITVGELTPGTKVALVDNKDVYEGRAAAPEGGRLLMQLGKNGPVTYTLHFKPTLDALVFSRSKLTVTKDKEGKTSGITHPKWSAVALDEKGKELSRVGEDLIASYEDVPAKSFALKGPGIAAVRFESDGRNFTAFSAVLVEKLVPQR